MRGATCSAPFLGALLFVISTHAPHAGSDWSQRAGRCTRSKFQPTLPMRGATGDAPLGGAHRPISTHAPHAGSDCDRLRGRGHERDFNPRSPCGERLRFRHPHLRALRISTHAPHAGSDSGRSRQSSFLIISTHAPHAGSDFFVAQIREDLSYFNPRSPCGERRGRPKGRIIGEKFQPTLPMRGATATYCVAHYIFTRYSQIS